MVSRRRNNIMDLLPQENTHLVLNDEEQPKANLKNYIKKKQGEL